MSRREVRRYPRKRLPSSRRSTQDCLNRDGRRRGKMNKRSDLAGSILKPQLVQIDPIRTEVELRSHTGHGRLVLIWFSSQSTDLLASPMSTPGTTLQNGNLYVHTASGERRQVWIWENGKWSDVEIYHPHPHLTGYVLNLLSNGEPSWVTMETIRTYKGRAKKRERERSSK